MNRLPEYLVRQTAKLIRSGWRNCDIEKEIGVNRNTVSRYRRMMGVANPSSHKYTQIVADAQEMPIAHVAKKYGYSRQQIYNILKRGAAMTPIKAIAYTIDRDKHKEQQAKRLKENYGRFRAKVVRDGKESQNAANQ